MLTALIPTKNHAKHLDELITQVIFAGKSPVTRLLICNDASTDETAVILAKYAGDERIQVFHNEVSMGGVAACMSMYPHIDTPYVMFMSSDDYFYPEKIASLFDGVVKNDAYVGFGKYVILDGEQTIELQHPGWQARSLPGADEFGALLGFDHYAFLCTSIFKKEFLPQYGRDGIPFDLALNALVAVDGLGEFRGMDWNLLLEMAANFPERFYFLDEYCGFFRKVESQLSSDELYVHTGRSAFEMAILILRHLEKYALRKRIKNSSVSKNAIKQLFYAKAGQITDTAKTTHNFVEIYKPLLLTADALLNNM